MIMLGNKITQPEDKLNKIQIDQLVAKIKRPDNKMLFLFDTLSSMVLLNPDAYKRKKLLLPYVVPSIFAPPMRKTIYFKHAEYIILDLDHLDQSELLPEKLKYTLSNDARVLLAFVSPSGSGLKVFFKLDKKIFDPKQYSQIYKIFAQNFAQAYQTQSAIDLRTNDVTRACFLSYDPNIYYNPKAEPIDTAELLRQMKTLAIYIEAEKQQKEEKTTNLQQNNSNKKLPKEIFWEIKQKLNPNYKPREKRKKNIFVPEELKILEKKVLEKMKNKFPEIKLESVKDVHYGKQFLFKYDIHYAELNVFFGKRGLTVVKTAKKINNPEFQNIIYQIFMQIVNDYEKIQTNSGGNSQKETPFDTESST